MATATCEQRASSEYEDLEDHHLLGLYLERRDEQAFQVLHDRYERRVKYFLHSRYGLSESEQEDLWQETLLRVHRHAHRFDPGVSGFRNWVYMIASNLGKNVLRNRSRDPQTDFSTLTKNWDEDSRPLQWADHSLSPEREWEKARARELVEEGVRELRPHHRIAFVLVNLRGWTYKHTARWLGLALGTVKSRVHRAEKFFVEAFEEIATQRVTPEGGRVRVTEDGEVQWAHPENENGASPWSQREDENDVDDEDAGTHDPDKIRDGLRAIGWTLEGGTWRQAGGQCRARVFLDEFVDEFPDLVTRWFLPE